MLLDEPVAYLSFYHKNVVYYWGMWKRKILPILMPATTVLLIIGISIAVIAFGRGYRLDIGKKSLGTTGLLTATSDPVGATVFINGKKQTATNANINLEPGWYTVTIAKEGFQTWEKTVRVQGEVVARADAMLFPTNPSLYGITTTGAKNPVLSPDGTKLAYIVPQTLEATNGGQLTRKDGVWVLDMGDKPLGFNRDAKQVLKAESLPEITNSTLSWSPDSKELLATIILDNVPQYYVLDASETNSFATPVPLIETLEKEWEEMSKTKQKEKRLSLKSDLLSVATSSMSIVAFSPNEEKILYEATASAEIPEIITPPLIGTNPTEETRSIEPTNIYVYDIKEDRNYLLGDKGMFQPSSDTKTADNAPPPYTIQWHPNSKHLIIASDGKIEIMEYDGTNKKTVYVGVFWDSFVAPWMDGNKLIILTNLNPAASTMPNLYAVGIR